MMYSWKMKDGDIVLDGRSRGEPITGADAARQIMENGLNLWRGDWPLDPTLGINWPKIIRDKLTVSQIISEISSSLLRNEKVQKVVDISLGYDTDQNRAQGSVSLGYVVIIDNMTISESLAL